MSLLGEELAEEWLNRQGYFTIRGVKVGTGEIDLLAIRQQGKGAECWHYEVHASLRPVSYMCPAPKHLRDKGKAAYNASKRSQDELREGVEEWLQKKFHDPAKVTLRKKLWDGVWHLGYIVANVRHPEELDMIASRGIHVVRIVDIISELSPGSRADREKHLVSGAVGTNLVELVVAEKLLTK